MTGPIVIRPTRRALLTQAGAAAGLACLSALPVARPARALVPTDLSLVLAIDCSWSVDQTEFEQQMQGTALALRDAEVVSAALSGPLGRISVAMVHWSSDVSQILAIPWTLIDGPEAALDLSDRILATRRETSEGGTAIGAALRFSTLLFEIDPHPGTRRVIDVSGDGRNNTRENVGPARSEALSYGITINGLPILTDDPTLDYYFRNVLIGGSGAFVEIARDYDAYAEAIRRKLLREIRYTGYS